MISGQPQNHRLGRRVHNANVATIELCSGATRSRDANMFAYIARLLLGAVFTGAMLFGATAGVANETSMQTAQQNPESSLNGLVFPAGAVFNFIERTGNALLATPLERQGQLWQERSNENEPTLIMELTEPRWERRELSEHAVSLVRRRPATGRSRPREQRLSMKLDASKPSHTLILALVSLVNGDHGTLLSQFAASPRQQDGADWLIALTPNIPIEGLCALRLTGNGDGMKSQLTRIHLDQCEQRWQEITLQHAPAT